MDASWQAAYFDVVKHDVGEASLAYSAVELGEAGPDKSIAPNSSILSFPKNSLPACDQKQALFGVDPRHRGGATTRCHLNFTV
jgi:hypothetical protein